MTPKEKAEELFNKFYPRATSYSSDRKNQKDNAKQCALIAIDEILVLGKKIPLEVLEFYLEVKQEIEKL
jgi:hypothetical protein